MSRYQPRHAAPRPWEQRYGPLILALTAVFLLWAGMVSA